MEGVIGWNRQVHGKAAGLRIHMLVSLGAALFVLIPLQVGVNFSPEALSRTIQGVATGVGSCTLHPALTRKHATQAKITTNSSRESQRPGWPIAVDRRA